MDLTGLEHEINGTTPMPKCNDLYTLLGAVNVKDYKCPVVNGIMTTNMK
jgi:hypothetical protein